MTHAGAARSSKNDTNCHCEEVRRRGVYIFLDCERRAWGGATVGVGCRNPGDLSRSPLEVLGSLAVYDRMPVEDDEESIRRIGDADIAYTSETLIRRAGFERYPVYSHGWRPGHGLQRRRLRGGQRAGHPRNGHPDLWRRCRRAVCDCPAAGDLPSRGAS